MFNSNGVYITITKWNSNGAEKKITMQVLMFGAGDVVVAVEKVASPLMRNRFDCVELLLFHPIHTNVYAGWAGFGSVCLNSFQDSQVNIFSLVDSFLYLFILLPLPSSPPLLLLLAIDFSFPSYF